MSKTSIQEEMRVIDSKDRTWWDSLSDEERKKLSLWVLMRYCSSVDNRVQEINEYYLTMTNELVNVNFNDLRHHPELQHRLMQAVGIGSKQLHPWIPPGKRKSAVKVNKQMFNFYLALYPHLNDEEIEFTLNEMTKEEKTALLESAGIEKKKIKDYLK